MTLKELKELAERATPGPWDINIVRRVCGVNHIPALGLQNAEFIAAANPQTILQMHERIVKLSEALQHSIDHGQHLAAYIAVPDNLYHHVLGISACEDTLSLYGSEVPLK